MEQRQLGRTDLKVSIACLGTMTYGNQNTEVEGHAQLDRALEAGINFIDTAEMYAVPPSPDTYGKTESIIGNWLASRPGMREKIVLATKVSGRGLRWVRDGNAIIDRKNILAAVEDSLKRLKTDYIDLYQLHWPNRPFYHFGGYWRFSPSGEDTAKVTENLHEVLQTLGELVQQGKIRHAGLSNESAWGTMKYLELAERFSLPRMASIQNEYSLLYRLFEPDLAEVAVREDVSLLAYSPLATGMLTGKYRNGKIPEGSRWKIQSSRHNQRNTPQAHAAVEAYLELSKRHDVPLNHLSLAFAHQKYFMTSVIIGATTMEQLNSDLEAFHLKLSNDIMKEIEQVRRDHPIPF
ncbi:MAG: aldo/keto reductase [Spirochaetaceae bacterium]|nr:aldo/keto reductase [Spirochaetaceae bacterium]|tara:strand:- start:93933 stop:94982 length:1050 start_codon:yes stop_codon:yes gene_type:complete